jgi:transcriptional regulator with XRE-family HTH domain
MRADLKQLEEHTDARRPAAAGLGYPQAPRGCDLFGQGGGVDLGPVIRAARRSRRLSQRDLAARAGVPRSTVDRIEAGRTSARFETVATLLAATGYGLIITDAKGRPLIYEYERERLVDRAGRKFPAHAPVWAVDGLQDYWWGWFRIAWWKKGNPLVPDNTFARKRRREHSAWTRSQYWMDAT